MKLVLPQDVLALIERLTPAMEATDQSVTACTQLDGPTKAAWTTFYREYKATVVSAALFGMGLISIGSTYDALISFEQQMIAWQANIVAKGCALVGGRYAPPPEHDNMTALEKLLMWGSIALGTATVAYAVSKLVPLAVPLLQSKTKKGK